MDGWWVMVLLASGVMVARSWTGYGPGLLAQRWKTKRKKRTKQAESLAACDNQRDGWMGELITAGWENEEEAFHLTGLSNGFFVGKESSLCHCDTGMDGPGMVCLLSSLERQKNVSCNIYMYTCIYNRAERKGIIVHPHHFIYKAPQRDWILNAMSTHTQLMTVTEMF